MRGFFSLCRISVLVLGIIISGWFVVSLFHLAFSNSPNGVVDLPLMEGASFRNHLKDFPWETLAHPSETNETLRLRFYETLMEKILPFVIMEPIVPVNNSCTPPPLELPLTPNCRKLERPRKVGMLFQFGFDIDILEIQLNELDDVVDRFFVLESTRSHYNASKKPLIWAITKHQPRFSKFLDKVVSFVLDDADLAGLEASFKGVKVEGMGDGAYRLETYQQRSRWKKFLQWNKMTQLFQDDDILGFGSSDEIPSRNNVYFLRNCEMPSDPVDIGIWMASGYVNQVFRSNFSVRGHNYTIGNPSFYTLAKATGLGNPNINQGRSDSFLLGGVHLSDYGYLPYQVAKHLTVLEEPRRNKDNTADLYDQLLNKPILEVELLYGRVASVYTHNALAWDKFMETEPQTAKALYYLPWFYKCNARRYPAWLRKHDTRLD